MKTARLENFTKGWFVGNFEPALAKTPDFEVAVKHYTAGDKEDRHAHKIAWEITAVISGKYIMAGKELAGGDIVFLDPGEAADFACLESGATVVVKSPSLVGDKYPA